MPLINNTQSSQAIIFQSGSVICVLLIFFIPFSTALTTVLPFYIAAAWLFSGQFESLKDLLQKLKCAIFAFLLFALLLIAVANSSIPLHESLGFLKKYRELLYLVIFIPFFQDPKYRLWAYYAFSASLLISVLASYLMYFDIIAKPASSYDSASIRMRITHSLMVAFFSFYCAHQFLNSSRFRYLWALAFLLSTINIFFMIEGRTGQLIYFLLIFLFTYQRLSLLKGMVFIAANIIFFILFLNFSDGGNRIHEGFANSQSYLQGHTETKSSMGQRMTFWKHAWTLITEKPIFGHGTGSYESGYARLASPDEIKTSNAHSEFLMITVQTGIVGLALFIALIAGFYSDISSLQGSDRFFAQGVWLAFLCNSAINSTLLDSTEGHWFAVLIALSLAPALYENSESSNR